MATTAVNGITRLGGESCEYINSTSCSGKQLRISQTHNQQRASKRLSDGGVRSRSDLWSVTGGGAPIKEYKSPRWLCFCGFHVLQLPNNNQSLPVPIEHKPLNRFIPLSLWSIHNHISFFVLQLLQASHFNLSFCFAGGKDVRDVGQRYSGRDAPRQQRPY
ncbi:hypothetical protein GJ744_009614 [Endocarpon pusillum]|uniref:Uncharacterized protein n=1 Tax=Endocarpon pusillum TaxID=364733 RepID=A0A8H7E3I3_9EURO|nr:hypothetical protein GJ744_009614 [Endocarpon pusillum]